MILWVWEDEERWFIPASNKHHTPFTISTRRTEEGIRQEVVLRKTCNTRKQKTQRRAFTSSL